MLYARPQLKLLLVFIAILATGLAVRQWRSGFPDLAERLERIDRDEPASPPIAPEDSGPGAPAPGARRTAATTRAGAESAPRAGIAPDDTAAAPADPRPLDVNRATADQLARLPGVGGALAARIVAERQRRGGFESPEALRYVLGMGPKKLAAIRELVSAEAAEARAADRDAPSPPAAQEDPDATVPLPGAAPSSRDAPAPPSPQPHADGPDAPSARTATPDARGRPQPRAPSAARAAHETPAPASGQTGPSALATPAAPRDLRPGAAPAASDTEASAGAPRLD